MNVIAKIQDNGGTVWGVGAVNNKFYIMHNEPGNLFWTIASSEVYNDPDQAIKELNKLFGVVRYE